MPNVPPSESNKPHISNINKVRKHCGVNCIYTNADRLTNKFEELTSIITNEQIHIAAIVETLPKDLKCTQTDPEDIKFVLPGYKVIHNNKGRGICLFIKDDFDFIRMPELELFETSIFGRVKTKTESFTLGAIYKSPNSSDDQIQTLFDQINAVANKHNSPNDNLVIVGDFNYPNINWKNETTTIKNSENPTNKFLSSIHDNYLFQLVDENTHYKPNTNPSLIDLILTNNNEFVENIEYYAPIGKSHHLVLNFNIQCDLPSPEPNTTVKYLLNHGDYNGMRLFMKDIKWDSIFEITDDVDDYMKKIESKINTAKKEFIPIKKGQSAKTKRTFSMPDSLHSTIKLKRKAFKHHKQFPTSSNYDKYAQLRQQVKLQVKEAKKKKELSIAKQAKLNPKVLYNYISSKTKPKETISDLEKPNGELTENDEEKSQVLCDFFSSVFVVEDDTNIPTFDCNMPIENDLYDITITEKDMFEALNSLNVNKSQGPDGIHPKLLKELAQELSYPLKLLFDKSLKEGKIPNQWKEAEVRPIFKNKGKKTSPGNYRPVSLTAIICKVFEKFIRDAMCRHFTENGLLSDEQYGFCKGRSCSTQLLVTLNDWMSSIDNKIPLDAAYLDFRKAFDSVPHKRLINKLKGYGVKGRVLNWVTDFLSTRNQFVSINGKQSHKAPVTSGVPQGSVLGPTLFIYYINDLPQVTNLLIKIFADDTKAYSQIRNEEDKSKLQKGIESLVGWSDVWLLRFNSDKCKVLHVGSSNPHHEYQISNDGVQSKLEVTHVEKDLGVYVDQNLDFKNHIMTTVKKGRSLAGMIQRNISFKTKEIMVPLFIGIVRPILEYANSTWSPHKKYLIKSLEDVQRQYTKRIFGMKKLGYSERLQRLGLPSLMFRRIRGDMIEVFKILHDYYDPITTKSLLTLNKTNYHTRTNNLKLVKKSFNTKKAQMFFTNRIINLWNSLPAKIVNSKSLNSFKNQIDQHLKKHMYKPYLDILHIK